jgi:hypothetical protein
LQRQRESNRRRKRKHLKPILQRHLSRRKPRPSMLLDILLPSAISTNTYRYSQQH